MHKPKLLIILIFVFSITICYQDDPHKFGSYLQALASQSNLTFLNKQLGRTVNNHSLQVFGLTLISNSKQFAYYKNHNGIIVTSFFHSKQLSSYNFFKQMAQEIVSQARNNPIIEYTLKNSVFLFMPYVNIDSVIYVNQLLQKQKQKTGNIEEFRKNMNFKEDSQKCSNIWNKGVDINRNFDYKYGTQPTSKDQCSEEYRGKSPFSEQQSQAIKSLYQSINIKISIDVHSYGNVWIYPFASEKDQSPLMTHQLYPVYEYIFEIFNNINARHANCYKQLGYLADGVYIDWALNQSAISFALQIGQNFANLGSSKETQKYLRSFIALLKIMGNSFEYKRSKSGHLCIDSYSLLSHNLTILDLETSKQINFTIQPQQLNKCILLNSNQLQTNNGAVNLQIQRQQERQLKLIIRDSNITQIIKYNKLSITTNNIQSSSEQQKSLLQILKHNTLAQIVLIIFILYIIGLLCGLSIFFEKALGIKIIDQEKLGLSQQSTHQIIKNNSLSNKFNSFISHDQEQQ